MMLKCKRKDCQKEWNYKGEGTFYATCPNCRSNVKIETSKLILFDIKKELENIDLEKNIKVNIENDILSPNRKKEVTKKEETEGSPLPQTSHFKITN